MQLGMLGMCSGMGEPMGEEDCPGFAAFIMIVMVLGMVV